MNVELQCPNPECRATLRVPDGDSDGRRRCEHCGTTFSVPVSTDSSYAPTVVFAEGAQEGPSCSGAFPDEEDSSASGSPGRMGRFEIRERLGGGGFGVVYRAYDPQLDREVALKVPRPEKLENPQVIERFLREAKAAARLNHPNIIPVYDAGKDGDQYFIASAFVEGRPLSELIEEEEGPDFRRAAEIVMRRGEALAYAHRIGIVHRDVKPDNVIIDERGEPHLMDFGLAHVAGSEERMTMEGAVLGTPAYMSPEQADGRLDEVGPGSDQYSLGIMLYELLCGHTPFSGPPNLVIFNTIHKETPAPRKEVPTVPRDLETLCLKALDKKPQFRYGSCNDLAEDLRRWLNGDPVGARPLGPVERFGRWCRREPVLAGLVTSVIILVFTIAIGAAMAAKRERALATDEARARRLAEEREAEAKLQRSAANIRRLAAEAQAALLLGFPQRSLLLSVEALRSAEHARIPLFSAAEQAFRDASANCGGLGLWTRDGRVHTAAFTPDGRRLATGVSDKGMALWDISAARHAIARERWVETQGEAKAVAFSQDGIMEILYLKPAMFLAYNSWNLARQDLHWIAIYHS